VGIYKTIVAIKKLILRVVRGQSVDLVREVKDFFLKLDIEFIGCAFRRDECAI